MRIRKAWRWTRVGLGIGMLAGLVGGPLAASGDEVEVDMAKVPLAELATTAWLAEDIGGAGVVDRVRSTLGFRDDAEGGVYGSGGCNRFNGSVSEADGRLVFGPLASTRRMCPPAVMDQEQRFFEALARVARFERRGPYLFAVDADGTDLARMTALEGEA